jgi:hypothetical protein
MVRSYLTATQHVLNIRKPFWLRFLEKIGTGGRCWLNCSRFQSVFTRPGQLNPTPLGSAPPGSAVLNSCALLITYSTQRCRMIRCTSSGLKPFPLGCWLRTWPKRVIPEYGSSGYGVKAASVGLWTTPCGVISNWSRLTKTFITTSSRPIPMINAEVKIGKVRKSCKRGGPPRATIRPCPNSPAAVRHGAQR